MEFIINPACPNVCLMTLSDMTLSEVIKISHKETSNNIQEVVYVSDITHCSGVINPHQVSGNAKAYFKKGLLKPAIKQIHSTDHIHSAMG